MTVRLSDDNIIEMSIDLSRFTVDREFEDEIFGWYLGDYIAIKKVSTTT